MKKKTKAIPFLVILLAMTILFFPGAPTVLAKQPNVPRSSLHSQNSAELFSSGTATANITSVYRIGDLYIYNSKAYISDVYSQSNIYIYNASEVVIDRVDSGSIYIYNSSRVVIRNSHINYVYVYNTATLSIKESYYIYKLYAYDSAKIDVTNSRIYYASLENSTVMYLNSSYVYNLYAGSDDVNSQASIYASHAEIYKLTLYALTTASLSSSEVTLIYMYGNSSASTVHTKLNWIYGYANSTLSSLDLFTSHIELYDNASFDADVVTTPYGGTGTFRGDSFARIRNNLFQLALSLYDEAFVIFENLTAGGVTLYDYSRAEIYNSRVDTVHTSLWSTVYAENSDLYSIEFNLFITGDLTIYNLSINNHYAYDYYEDSSNPNYRSSIVLKDCTLAFYHATLNSIFVNSSNVDIVSTAFYDLTANGSSNVDIHTSTFSYVYLYDTSTLNLDGTNTVDYIYLYDQSALWVESVSTLIDIYLYGGSYANLTNINCNDIYVYDTSSLLFYLSGGVNVYAETSIYSTYVPQTPNIKIINSTLTGNVINNGTSYMLINFTSIGGSVWSFLNGTTEIINSTISGNIYWTANVLSGNVVIDSYLYYISGGNYWFNSSWEYASNVRNNTLVADTTYTSVLFGNQIFYYGGTATLAIDVPVESLRSSVVIVNGSFTSPAGDTLSYISSDIYAFESAEIKLYDATIASSLQFYDQTDLIATNVAVAQVASFYFNCESVLFNSSTIDHYLYVYGTTFLNLTQDTFQGTRSLYMYDNSTAWLYKVDALDTIYLLHNSSLSLYWTSLSGDLDVSTTGSVYIANSSMFQFVGSVTSNSITAEDSIINNFVNLTLDYSNLAFTNVSDGGGFRIYNGTVNLDNVTISGTAHIIEYSVILITETKIESSLYFYDNTSATVQDSELRNVYAYGSSEVYIQNATFTGASSYLYLYDTSNCTLINSTLPRIITHDSSKLSLELHSVTMDLIRIYETSYVSGVIDNSTINELRASDNGTAIIDAQGNTNFTTVNIFNFGYLELTNADQIGTAYIASGAYYKPLLSGNITLIRSDVWIDGSATIDNRIPTGSFSVFARGSFTINELLPWHVYLNETDDLTMTATDVSTSIVMYDNSRITLNGTLDVNEGITAYNNSEITILADVHLYHETYLYDSATLNISGIPLISSISTLYAFNSSTVKVRNATIDTMYVSGVVTVDFLSYENTGVGPLNETITITNLYVAPYVLTSSGLGIDVSIQHDPIITSVDQAEQYLTISGIFEGYNLRVSLYDAVIDRMYLDNVTSGYFNNVSFSSPIHTSGIGLAYDFFDTYLLEPVFYGNVTLENCTAKQFYAISSKPTIFINSSIDTLVYAYLVNDTNTLELMYDTNSTDILNSGTGYVTYINVTSTITTYTLAALGAVDNGRLIIKSENIPYQFTSSTTYQRATSPNWSGVNKTQFYIEYDYTQYGINHLEVTVHCDDDNITWTRIDVMAANGTWYTIVNDTFNTTPVTSVTYSFDNFTDIFGSLAYKVKVWANVSDNSGATQVGYIQITRTYDLGTDSIELIYAKDSAVIEVNKAYVDLPVFLKNDASLNIYETGYVASVTGFENTQIFVNNTITDFNCPYLENQTTIGINELSLFEHSTAEIYNSYLDVFSSWYSLFDKTSLSVHDSFMRNSLTSGIEIDILGESSLTLDNVSFTYLYVDTPEGTPSLSISDSDFYRYEVSATNALVNSMISNTNITYVYIYGNGSYVFDTVMLRNTYVYLYSPWSSWTFRNMTYMYSQSTQVYVSVNYDYEISNVLDVMLMYNDQLYAGNSRVMGSNSRLSFTSVTLRDVGAYYTITVTDPVIDYDSTTEVISISGVTATCNNTAHDTLDSTEAIQHYYVIYDSSSNEVLRGDLTYAGNYAWTAENVSVASLLPGTYSVVAYFTDSDAFGQSAPVSLTIVHHLTITSPTLEYDDVLGYVSIYGIHVYSSYAPFGEVDDSEVVSATYQIINNDTGDVVSTGNLTWTGNSWAAMNISTTTLPAGVYYCRVYFRDALNSENTSNSTTFAVGTYFMLFGSRVSMMTLILGIVAIALAAGIPIAVFLILLKKGKLQNLFSKKS